MAKLRVTQVKSANGARREQRATLASLGLGHIGRSTERDDSAQLRGMLHAVRHLVRVDSSDG